MFVSYDEESAIEITRKEKNCVICGLDSTLTNQKGEDAGYCGECAKKRKEFVEKEIDELWYYSLIPATVNKNNNAIFAALESIRNKEFKDRLNYVFDKYFMNNPDQCYNVEFDENTEFMIIFLKEKIAISDFFIESLKSYVKKRNFIYRLISKKARISNFYYDYVQCLIEYRNDDFEKLSSYTKTLKDEEETIKKLEMK